jgi:L-asparagine transporter-like permease
MFLSVLAECFVYVLMSLGDLAFSVFATSNDKSAWKRWLLVALAVFELVAIVIMGYFLQPHLPQWGFVLALLILVFAAAAGLFSVAHLIVKEKSWK